MKTTLFVILITTVLLLCLRQRRDADDAAIATLRKWREGR
jgi:hypothetical protein